MRNMQSFKSSTVLNYVLAVGYSLLIIIPIYYLLLSSFKSNLEIFTSPMKFPISWKLDNFFEAQKKVDLLGAIFFSAKIVLSAETVCLALSFFAAYAIARFKIKESHWVEMFFGAGFLVPAFAVLVPVFLLAVRLNLLYSPVYLVFFYAAFRLPLSVILLTSYLRVIPLELEECAYIDGASQWQVLRHIIFPLSRSGVITVLVLNFLAFWNEYLFALILLDPNTRTIQLALPLLKSERISNYGLLSAGIILSLIPVYIVFIIFQGRIVNGMLEGGVKG